MELPQPLGWHLARHPAYRTPSYLAEGQGMWNRTLAEVIALDIGHGRAHLGEAGLVKALARQDLDR